MPIPDPFAGIPFDAHKLKWLPIEISLGEQMTLDQLVTRIKDNMTVAGIHSHSWDEYRNWSTIIQNAYPFKACWTICDAFSLLGHNPISQKEIEEWADIKVQIGKYKQLLLIPCPEHGRVYVMK